MIFTPRNKVVYDISIIIDSTKIPRVYVSKFLGVQIDSQLSWKMHINYICKKLSKCTAILLKARKVLGKSCLTTLNYTFAYPYFIYCNPVWGNTYQTNLEKLMVIHKKNWYVLSQDPLIGPIITKDVLLVKEKYYMRMLSTLYPFGLNDYVKSLKSYCSEIQHRFLPAVHIQHTILS